MEMRVGLGVGGCVTFVFCLLSVAGHVSGIKCYECNTKEDPSCGDPFNATAAHLSPKECVFDSRPALETILAAISQLQKVPEVLISPQGPVIFPSTPTTCQKIDVIVLGERITGRACTGPETNKVSSCDSVKLVTSDDLQLEFCAVCDADACNSATTILGRSVAVAVGLIVMCVMTAWDS